MSDFRLSNRATIRLEEIYQFSEERFGRNRAEKYLAAQKRSIALLAEFPRKGRVADEIGVGLKLYRFQSHYIVYSLEPDHILIRRLVHVSQELRSDIIE